ncbi:hypothetical protein SAMN04487949_2556 [Halogranum gelatinilyticum]|uniref:Uncharacterized protein n=1 Tax=Halogranum gelatinilyticum TaxID=660521 RepID=A0A1G9VZG0_9EURY|nr:DUF5779 family protein [Halogranum gelatinilyticum]SDM77341.1 hypothetical protein SAMN04487949_2556 [Halogranum gelatinilyticum]
MSDFELDLRGAEDQLDDVEIEGNVVLGVLDGSTEPDVWIRKVQEGNVLFLAIEGDLNALAAGFAREVKDMGGELMHFRKFLIVAPENVDIDTSRLD